MHDVFPAIIRLQRQVSYFGHRDGVNGLLRHLQEDEVNCQVLKMLWDGRTDEDIPYKPFSEWPAVVDPAFKDLIRGLTNLDPTKRLTARQALEHPWFMDTQVEDASCPSDTSFPLSTFYNWCILSIPSTMAKSSASASLPQPVEEVTNGIVLGNHARWLSATTTSGSDTTR